MDRDCGNMHYTLFDIVGIGNIGNSCSCSEDSYPTVGVTMFLHGSTWFVRIWAIKVT